MPDLNIIINRGDGAIKIERAGIEPLGPEELWLAMRAAGVSCAGITSQGVCSGVAWAYLIIAPAGEQASEHG
jgi:hypothetical protein